jgi:hypothetical protein
VLPPHERAMCDIVLCVSSSRGILQHQRSPGASSHTMCAQRVHGEGGGDDALHTVTSPEPLTERTYIKP